MNEEFLYRYIKCQLSSREEERVLNWLDESEEHRKMLHEIQRRFDVVTMCAPTINRLYAKDRRTLFSHNVIRWTASVAACVLLVFCAYFYHQTQRLTSQSEQLLTLVVPHGQHINLTLQDGTSVWLNSGTTISYPSFFAKDERRVSVEGEAKFDVKHDAQHPFIVETYACDVKVLGTKFNLRADKEQNYFSTALFEGSVLVNSHQNEGYEVVLKPNQVVTLKGEHFDVEPLVDPNEYRWNEGIINLTGHSFRELMQRFSKAFGVEIRIEQEPKSYSIGQGKIRQSIGIDNALQVLQQFAEFDYEKDENANIITIK